MLVVEVQNGPVFVILEIGFVGPDHFRVLTQPRPHSRAQPKDALHAVGGQERVTENLRRLLPDTVHPARTLS